MMRAFSLPLSVGAALAGLSFLVVSQADAACTRMGFTVNDYGKEGPTNDAKSLLDKHIAKWAGERGIEKYTTGKKDVKCELFLDVILFDEHTCTASATVCWDGPAPAGVKETAAPAEEQQPGQPAKPKTKAAGKPLSEGKTVTGDSKPAAPSKAAAVEAPAVEAKPPGHAAAQTSAPAAAETPAAPARAKQIGSDKDEPADTGKTVVTTPVAPAAAIAATESTPPADASLGARLSTGAAKATAKLNDKPVLSNGNIVRPGKPDVKQATNSLAKKQAAAPANALTTGTIDPVKPTEPAPAAASPSPGGTATP